MGRAVKGIKGKKTSKKPAGWGGKMGGIRRLERRNRGIREGCNAETCQKRAPGPPCGMWPVCLPRKNRAGKREDRKWRWGQFCPIIEVGGGGEEEKTMSGAGQCRGRSGKVRV